jgi:hypothetical protein
MSKAVFILMVVLMTFSACNRKITTVIKSDKRTVFKDTLLVVSIPHQEVSLEKLIEPLRDSSFSDSLEVETEFAKAKTTIKNGVWKIELEQKPEPVKVNVENAIKETTELITTETEIQKGRSGLEWFGIYSIIILSIVLLAVLLYIILKIKP